MNLTGKNIVFVGGCGGIGLATCKVLMQKNVANIFILDIAEHKAELESLRATNTQVNVQLIHYDLSMAPADMTKVFAQIVDKLQHIDILVNGGGIFNDHNVNATITTNLIGLINTTEVVYRLWDKRHGGNGGLVINIASVAGLDPYPTVPVYSASKAGIIAFTQSLAQVQEETGVTMFVVCPGITRTPMMRYMPTFLDLDPKLTEKASKLDVQTAAECAVNIVSTIEKQQNGAVWMLDMGNMELIPAKVHWKGGDDLLNQN